MAFAEQDKQAMDEAATDAQNDLVNLPEEAIAAVASWIKKWYMKAGYKRLSRVLLEAAKQKEEDSEYKSKSKI